MSSFKPFGKWDPGIDLGLLPLLERDENQILLSLEITRQSKLLALQV